MSDFVAGFAPRHQATVQVLERAFSAPEGFAAADPKSWASRATPRHFSPADPDARPTAGWDPLDPEAQPSSFVDPLEAAHAAGYAEGLAAAATGALEATNRDSALFDGIAAALSGAGQVDREAIAQQLRQTVLSLVGKVLGENGVAPDLLAGRIDAAADLLADKAESAMLRVHPDDVPLLDGRLPRQIFAIGDAALRRGSFVLESASTVVEDGPDLWLEQLAQAIDRVPVPDAPRPC